MADALSVKFAWLIIGIFAARYFASAASLSELNCDLGWQRPLGQLILRTGRLPHSIGFETFTAPGSAWIPQEWLFSIAAYLGQGPWWYVLAAFCALCATCALILGAWQAARAGSPPIALALAVLPAGMALVGSFGVRDQVVAWPILALFLLLLEVDGPAMFWAVAVVAIWSNVHASVMLAAPMAFVVALGSWFDERLSRRTKRLLLVAVASLLATCANPLGWDIPHYAFTVFSSSFKAMIVEWQPTDLDSLPFAFGALPMLLIFMLFGIHGPRCWSRRMLVITTAILMFGAVRNISIFAIVCLPIVASSLAAGLATIRAAVHRPETAAERRAGAFVKAFAVVAAVVVAALIVSRSHFTDVANDDLQPALASIVSLPGTHNVFCFDFAWCSFLIATPRTRVFIDGRADPYPPAVWKDYQRINRLQPGWAQALSDRRVDTILITLNTSLEQALEISPNWRSVYRNTTYHVWAKRQHSLTTATAKL